MHLVECAESILDSSGSSSVRSCVSNWFFKSTTSFYGFDDRLLGGPIFGFLCWNYTIAGIFMLVIKPRWIKKSFFPITLFAMILIFIQGEVFDE